MRKLLLFLLSFTILVSWATSAFAEANYWVTARNYNTGNYAYGTKAGNYVMSSPKITNMHVNSVYVYDAGGAYAAECGWVWYAGYSKPYWFAQQVINGAIGPLYKFDQPTPGTNHTIQVKNNIGTNDFSWIIDGVTKKTLSMGGWRHGETWASSERNSLDESNYGHFWSLQRMNSSGTWYYWDSLVNNWTNDPSYILVKVSNTECYMQLP